MSAELRYLHQKKSGNEVSEMENDDIHYTLSDRQLHLFVYDDMESNLSAHEGEFKNRGGRLENCDQIVPELSQNELENLKLKSAISNVPLENNSHPHADNIPHIVTNSNDQTVPEVMNSEMNHYRHGISQCDMENNHHPVSETLLSDVENQVSSDSKLVNKDFQSHPSSQSMKGSEAKNGDVDSNKPEHEGEFVESSELAHEGEFKNKGGRLENCDQIVPELSQNELENLKLKSAISNVPLENNSHPHADNIPHIVTNSNDHTVPEDINIDDEIVPEVMNSEINHFRPETSQCDMKNNHHPVSEILLPDVKNQASSDSEFINKYLQSHPLSHSMKDSDANKGVESSEPAHEGEFKNRGGRLENCDQTVPEPSHELENQKLKCAISNVPLKNNNHMLADNILCIEMNIDGKIVPAMNSEGSDAKKDDTEIDCPLNIETSKFNMQNSNQSLSEIQEKTCVQGEPSASRNDTNSMQVNPSNVRKRKIKSFTKDAASCNNSISSSNVKQQSCWRAKVWCVILFVIGFFTEQQICRRPKVWFVILFVLGYFSFFTPSNISPRNKFIGHVKNMEQTFPNQCVHFWKTVRSSAVNVFIENESKHPAVIIIASSTVNSPVSLCIAKQLSHSFELSWDLSPNTSLVDINHLKHLHANDQKLQLDDIIDSTFSTHKTKSIIVENLQFLEPAAALIFYNYCDNTNAPYRDVMFLFTLYFDEKEREIQSSNYVEKYLEKIWSRSMSVDKIKPLMSRVANNIVIVRGDNSVTCF